MAGNLSGGFLRGSDGSAACGGYSDLSEWQRSARDEGAPSPRTFAGHRNRISGRNVGKR